MSQIAATNCAPSTATAFLMSPSPSLIKCAGPARDREHKAVSETTKASDALYCISGETFAGRLVSTRLMQSLISGGRVS